MKCKSKTISGVKVIALVSAVCTAALASCASSNTNPDAGNALLAAGATEGSYGVFNTEEQVTLTVWESRSESGEFIKQAGAKYHETHPNVTIKYVNVELGDAAWQIAQDGPEGFGADLFAAPADSLGKLVNGWHILPTVDPYGVKARVLGSCSKALTYNGKMYGYPISAETYALFYNRELISDDEVPTTWEDLRDWVIEFNASHPGKLGFVMEVGNAYYSVIFTTANGNRLFGKNGDDTYSTYLNTPDAVAGMKFFQSLRSALNVPAENLNTGNCDGAFQGGSAAMCITGPWNIANFEYAGLDFGVAPLPALPGDSTPAASFSGTRAMFVSAYTHHPDEAADFARFLISEDMQRLRFDITGATPSIRVQVSSPYIGGFLEQLEYAFPMPSAPQMSEFWMAFGSASANIWNGSDVQRELDACNRTILGR